MRKALRLVLLLWLLPLSGLSAQAVVGETRFSPPDFYVGDSVKMTIILDLTDPVVIEAPGDMPESDWVEIRNITAESDGRTAVVTIDFIPFAPGNRTLPPMELGGLQIRDMKVSVRSVLSGDRTEVRTLRGQRLLPGTRLAVALILALAAMAPFLGFGAARSLWRRMRKLRELWRTGRPARRLRRLMKSLHLAIGDVTAVHWYSRLTEALRKYISSRIGKDCTSSTTAEIATMKEFRTPDTPQAAIIEVLHEGDMVKFAGRFADDRSLERILHTVEKAIQEWEKANDQLQ